MVDSSCKTLYYKKFPCLEKPKVFIEMQHTLWKRYSPAELQYTQVDLSQTSAQHLVATWFFPRVHVSIEERFNKLVVHTSCKFMVSFMYITFFSSRAFICFLMSDSSSARSHKSDI